VIARDGGKPSIVYSSKELGGQLLTRGWTKDKKWILVTFGREGDRSPSRLALVPVDGGEPRVLKHFENGFAGRFQLAPDGGSVAYDRPAQPGSPRKGVYWMSLDKGNEVSVLTDGANNSFLAWFPDGRRILFASDRGGTSGIWSTRIVDGRAQGEPVLLRSESGPIQAIGFTSQGDYFYYYRETQTEIYLADIDPGSGRRSGSVARLESRFLGRKRQASWSPTGDRLAFVQEPVTRVMGPVQDQKLAIQTMADGHVHLIPLALQNMQNPAWVDNRTIVVQGRTLEGAQGLHLVNVETGALTTIAKREPSNDVHRTLGTPSPDGRIFFQYTSATTNATGIAVRDLPSGREEQITRHPAATFALSPEGKWLAIVESRAGNESDRHLSIVPSSGGESKKLASSATQWVIQGPITWSKDGRYVFVVRAGERAQEIWQVPVDGTEPRDTGIRWSGGLARLSAHPDGKRLALSAQTTTFRTWALQNIPPQK
jgi:Tol biopolymer transport system component